MICKSKSTLFVTSLERIMERDIAKCYADPAYAEEILGWKAKRGINEMCEDSWRWQSMNPDGYSR